MMCNACGIYKQTHGYNRNIEGRSSGGGGGETPQRKARSSGGGGNANRRTSSHGSPSVGVPQPAASVSMGAVPFMSSGAGTGVGVTPATPLNNRSLPGRPPLPPRPGGTAPRSGGGATLPSTATSPVAAAPAAAGNNPFPLDAHSPMYPQHHAEDVPASPLQLPPAASHEEAASPHMDRRDDAAINPSSDTSQSVPEWSSLPSNMLNKPQTAQLQQQNLLQLLQQLNSSGGGGASLLNRQQKLTLLAEHQAAMMAQMNQAKLQEMAQQAESQAEQLMLVAQMRQSRHQQHQLGQLAPLQLQQPPAAEGAQKPFSGIQMPGGLSLVHDDAVALVSASSHPPPVGAAALAGPPRKPLPALVLDPPIAIKPESTGGFGGIGATLQAHLLQKRISDPHSASDLTTQLHPPQLKRFSDNAAAVLGPAEPLPPSLDLGRVTDRPQQPLLTGGMPSAGMMLAAAAIGNGGGSALERALLHQHMSGYGQQMALNVGQQPEWGSLMENGGLPRQHQTQAWPWLKERVVPAASGNQAAAAAAIAGPQAAAISALLLGLKNSTAASSDNVALFQGGQVCGGPAPFVIFSLVHWDS